MTRTKTLLGVVVALAVAVSQSSLAVAAPQLDPVVGTIDTITANDLTSTVTVEYSDGANDYSVNLSYDEAETLGLISVDENGVATVVYDPAAGPIGITVDDAFDPPLVTVNLTNAVLLDEADDCAPGSGEEGGEILAEDSETLEDEEGGEGHRVAGALCDFFGESLGLTYDDIMEWHMNGFGFGVIAQALFIAQVQGLDPEDVLLAKSEKEFEDIAPEGVNNWGLFKKWALGGEVPSLTNLGAINSGRATPPAPAVTEAATEPAATEEMTLSAGTTLSTTTIQGKGYGKGGKPEKGKGKGHNK